MFQTHYCRGLRPRPSAKPANPVEGLVLHVLPADRLVAVAELVTLTQAEARRQGDPVPGPKAVEHAAAGLARAGLAAEMRPLAVERFVGGV